MNRLDEGHRFTVTEAQLRWAQFHHKQKAQQTQQMVERLMRTPSTPVEDDDEDENDDENVSKRPISRGRRAYLRASQRAYEQRRKRNAELGFQKRIFEVEPEEDALATIFAEHCVLRTKRKRPRPSTTQFDMAFRALMFSLAAAAAQQREPNIEIPTKKWTRPSGFSSEHWGTVPSQPNRRTSAQFGLEPMDREASWLRLLPAARRSSQHPSHQQQRRQNDVLANDTSETIKPVRPSEPTNLSSYQSQKILIAEQEEKQSNDHETIPLSVLEPSLPNDALGFVRQLVKQMETAAKEEPLVTADGKLHKPTFARLMLRYLGQIQKKEVMKSPVAMARARRGAGSIAKRRQGSSPTPPINESDLVLPYNMSSGFVKNFIAQIEATPENEEVSVVTREGKLDIELFERMITGYLARAADQTLMEATQQQNTTPVRPTPKRAPDKSAFLSHTPSSDVFEHIFNETAKKHKPALAVWESKKAISSVAMKSEENGIAGTTKNNFDDIKGQIYAGESIDAITSNSGGDTEETKDSSKPQGLVSRMAESMPGRVGDFLKRLHAGADGDSTSETRALAAFREAQRERQSTDDTLSHSTFRAMPTSLMNVVKNFQRSPEVTQHMGGQDLQNHSFDESLASSFTRGTNQSGVELPLDSLNEIERQINGPAEGIASESNLPFIDTDGSEASFPVQERNLSNLLLSPTLLTKRHQQAMRAIESRNWDQVNYLINANHWLAEMSDIKSGQYLLHALAYYGTGELEVDPETEQVVAVRFPPAPDQINIDLVRMHASAVHKFDQDGNLPLHMAAASGNLPMINILGERFPGGASVRNEDGMLPLHLAILVCATMPVAYLNEDTSAAVEIVRAVISYFPAAVGVTDNDGNLPIHTGASVLTGVLGADIIFLLLDEADKQLAVPHGIRFRNRIVIQSNSDENDVEDVESTYSSPFCEDDLQCTLVKNDRGENPLAAAIKAKAGWEVIEAIACSRGGHEASLECDSDKNNALHLLASALYYDPDAIFSILKTVPTVASSRNIHGVLPIEVACMQSLPSDVLVAIVLEDLPIDIDQTNDISMVSGRGASWWYLTCECDDFFANIVEDVISFCSVEQARSLCLVKNSSGETLLQRASPKCRLAMQAALRVAGRFEYDETKPIFEDNMRGLRIYEAYDHGDIDDGEADGKKVSLRLFSNYKAFQEEISIIRQDLDFSVVEEILMLCLDPAVQIARFNEKQDLFVVSVEEPALSLRSVVKGMLDSEECQRNTSVRQRYAMKVFAVLRVVVKALRHLHSMGMIHGKVNAENCCKYGDRWKIRGVLGSQKAGTTFKVSRFSSASPPECFESIDGSRKECMVSFKSDFIASYSVDSWSFGKLCFEVLVGRPLIELDPEHRFEDDQQAMRSILNWNASDCLEVRDDLRAVGVIESGIKLVATCLDPNPLYRPTMGEIMSMPLWKELKNFANIPRKEV